MMHDLLAQARHSLFNRATALCLVCVSLSEHVTPLSPQQLALRRGTRAPYGTEVVGGGVTQGPKQARPFILFVSLGKYARTTSERERERE